MKKYILGAVLSLGIIISPALTSAAGLTSQQVDAILSLLSSFGADSATIANVNTALGGTTSSSPSTAFCYTFNNDLTIGSNSNDVGYLRNVLNREGLLTQMRDAPFEEDLAGDVVRFQARYGIRQTGYVGPLTRARLNALYGCSNQTTVSSVPIVSSWNGPGGSFAPGIRQTVIGQYLSTVTSISLVSIDGSRTYGLEWSPRSDTSIGIAMPSSPQIPSGRYYLYLRNSVGTSAGTLVDVSNTTQPNTTSASVTNNIDGHVYIIGDTVMWGSRVNNVPSGSRLCMVLIRSSDNHPFAFPSEGSCRPISITSGGIDVTGTLISNSGYNLTPGQYKLKSTISGQSNDERDGPLLAEYIGAPFTIVSPTTPAITGSVSGSIINISYTNLPTNSYVQVINLATGSLQGGTFPFILGNGTLTRDSVPAGTYLLRVIRNMGSPNQSVVTESTSLVVGGTNVATTVPAIVIRLNGSVYNDSAYNAQFGTRTTVEWNVTPTGGTTCTAAGIGIDGGADAINLGGSWTTPALYTSTTYGVKCTNSLGTTYKYVNISVPPQTTTATSNTAPTITLNGDNTSSRLSLNVEFGRTATFTWGVTPTTGTACAAAGIGVNGATGSGAVTLSGTWTTPALYTNTTYGIACANTTADVVSGTTYKYADVTVAPQANTVAPTLTFTASPSPITAGQSSTLFWNSTNATVCLLNNERANLSVGFLSTGSLYETKNFTVTCTGPGGSITKSATVTVNPVATACTWNGGNVGIWGAGCNAPVSAGTTVQSGQTSERIYNTASGYTTNTSYIQYSCTNGQFAPVNPVCVASVAPVNTSAPTISYFYPISASVTSGTAPTLDWYVTPASGTTATCSMTGNWGGSLSQGLRPASAGGWGANNITSDTTYTLTCTNTNAGGSSTSRTTTVTIAAATAPAASTAVSCTWDGGLIGPWGSGCNANVGRTTVASGGSTGTINNTTAGYTGYVSFNCSDNGSFTVASQYCAPMTASALNALGSATQSSSPIQGMTSGFSYTFTQDMYRGTQGSEVVALQRALHAEGLFAGEATGNFYDVTREAVIAFQIRYGINSTGYVGSETRAKLNALY